MNPLSIKREIKKNVLLSFPLIASQLLYSSAGFLSTAMLAHLGKTVLASIVLINMIWFSLSVIFFGLLSAISVLVSHQFGAKQHQEVGKIMGQALYLSAFLMALIFLVLQTVPWFFNLAHESPVVVSNAMRYLHAMKFWIPALTFMIAFEQLLIGLGETRMVMIISVSLVPLQVFFMYAFIFGQVGFPSVGIQGAGYGIALADSMGLLGLLVYLLLNKRFQCYELFAHCVPRWRYLNELVRVGTPMGMMSLIECSAFTVMTFGIAHFGTTALAAHQIVLQYLGLFITIVFAMSQAITVRVGHAVGANDKAGIYQAVVVGMGLNFCIIGILAIVTFFFHHTLVHFDLDIHAVNNRLLMRYITPMFHIISFLLIFDNFRIIGFGALRGIKDTQFPMLASFLAFWLIGISAGLLLGYGAVGIWMGMTMGIASGAVLVVSRLIYRIKKLDLEKIMSVA
jgi:MATE family multidrug resistance protein